MASISVFWQWYRRGCCSGPWPWLKEWSAQRSHWSLQGQSYVVDDIVNFCVDIELCTSEGGIERNKDDY